MGDAVETKKALKKLSPSVVILKCNSYNPDLVYEKIIQGMELLGGIEKFIKKGEKILLKPNLLAPDPPQQATTTHPAVFQAVGRFLLEYGVEVCCGDSPNFYDPIKTMKKAGLYNITKSLNFGISDFYRGEEVFFKQGIQNRVFTIARGVLEADGIVSLPKLKTHGLTIITGAIKNQFGCIPGRLKAGFHAKLGDVEKFSQMLVDLTLFLKPRLYIMDAITAMEGNGPRRGKPVHLGVILISEDPVAMDTVASILVGLNPEHNIPVKKGRESKLGKKENLTILGESIQSVSKKLTLPPGPGNRNTIPPVIRKVVKRFIIPRPVINLEKCNRCQDCYTVCPTIPKSIHIREDGYPEHLYKYCINCYCCQETCPRGAIYIRIKPF